MAPYKRNLLNHFKALQPALLELGAEAFLDPCTFMLRVRLGGVARVLYPQFLVMTNGVRQYTPVLNADAARFIGWCPYVNRRWPLATEKLLFKRFAGANSILTPDYSTDSAKSIQDVIVKKSVSSFAADIKGPFKSSSEHVLDAAAGEYFERLVVGRIAKIWYWNEQPICMELGKMPIVTGDGTSRLRRLLWRRWPRMRREYMHRFEPFLKYQDATLDTVLRKGVTKILEYRYGEPILLGYFGRDTDLTKDMIPSLAPQLLDIGQKLWRGIPEQTRANTVFTIDAIVDKEDRIWTLEMNSNPFMHPYVYPTMLQSLFTSKGESANANQPVPALNS